MNIYFTNNITLIDSQFIKELSVSNMVNWTNSNSALVHITNNARKFLADVNTIKATLSNDMNSLYQGLDDKEIYKLKSIISKETSSLQTDEDYLDLGKKIYGFYKTLLPCFSTAKWRGTRKDINVVNFDGLVGLDFDDKAGVFDLEGIKETLLQSKYRNSITLIQKTFSGKGLRILLNTDLRIEDFNKKIQGLINEISEYVGAYHEGFELDGACKNITRVWFCSPDSDLYINEDSVKYSTEHIKTDSVAKNKTVGTTKTEIRKINDFVKHADIEGFEELLDLATKSKGMFMPGNRHNFLVSLAGFAFSRRWNMETLIDACVANLTSKDFTEFEIRNTVYSIYSTNTQKRNALEQQAYELDGIERTILNFNKYITETEESTATFLEHILDTNTVVIAPTGAGKTHAISKLLETKKAIDSDCKTVIIAPQKGISVQIAKNLDVIAINEDTEPYTDLEEVCKKNVVVTTYNSLKKVLKILERLNYPIEMIDVIVDEAHCLNEKYRKSVMKSVTKMLPSFKTSLYLSATINNETIKRLPVNKIVVCNIDSRIKNKVKVIEVSSAKDKKSKVASLTETLKHLYVERPSHIISVLINDGDVIKGTIDLLHKEFSNIKTCVFASDNLGKEQELEESNKAKEISLGSMVDDDTNILFATNAMEYGVSINNNKEVTTVITDLNQSSIDIETCIQFTARFRNPKDYENEVIVLTNKKDKKNNILFSEVLESQQKAAEDIRTAMNNLYQLQKKYSDDTQVHKVTAGSKAPMVDFNKETDSFEVCKESVYQTARELFLNSLGYEDLINEIQKMDDSFVYEGKYGEVSTKKLKVTGTLGNQEISADYNQTDITKVSLDKDSINKIMADLVKEKQFNGKRNNLIKQLIYFAKNNMNLTLENWQLYELGIDGKVNYNMHMMYQNFVKDTDLDTKLKEGNLGYKLKLIKLINTYQKYIKFGFDETTCWALTLWVNSDKDNSIYLDSIIDESIFNNINYQVSEFKDTLSYLYHMANSVDINRVKSIFGQTHTLDSLIELLVPKESLLYKTRRNTLKKMFIKLLEPFYNIKKEVKRSGRKVERVYTIEGYKNTEQKIAPILAFAKEQLGYADDMVESVNVSCNKVFTESSIGLFELKVNEERQSILEEFSYLNVVTETDKELEVELPF